MLKTRVIPTLLWRDFGLVKGVGFDSWRRVGPVLPALKVYNRRDVDELILVDICATADNQEPDTASVAEFAEHCFVPFTVGGGVRKLDHFSALLRAGADKIAVNSALYDTPDLVDAAARRYGAQCVVASLDARREADGRWELFSHCGKMATGRAPMEMAREIVDRGAGEILLTSIERDGAMDGYDLELIAAVANAVDVPVIASGGAGGYEHMRAAVQDAGAAAAAAASIFHFTQATPAEAKTYLREAGVPTRLG